MRLHLGKAVLVKGDGLLFFADGIARLARREEELLVLRVPPRGEGATDCGVKGARGGRKLGEAFAVALLRHE